MRSSLETFIRTDRSHTLSKFLVPYSFGGLQKAFFGFAAQYLSSVIEKRQGVHRKQRAEWFFVESLSRGQNPRQIQRVPKEGVCSGAGPGRFCGELLQSLLIRILEPKRHPVSKGFPSPQGNQNLRSGSASFHSGKTLAGPGYRGRPGRRTKGQRLHPLRPGYGNLVLRASAGAVQSGGL